VKLKLRLLPPFTSKTSILRMRVRRLTFVTTQKNVPSTSGITGGVTTVAA
jgi:hypothetical protein